MEPIRAQLCTWWKRMAGANWIAAGNGSRPEMARGRGWLTGDGSPETDDSQSPFLYEDMDVM